MRLRLWKDKMTITKIYTIGDNSLSIGDGYDDIRNANRPLPEKFREYRKPKYNPGKKDPWDNPKGEGSAPMSAGIELTYNNSKGDSGKGGKSGKGGETGTGIALWI